MPLLSSQRTPSLNLAVDYRANVLRTLWLDAGQPIPRAPLWKKGLNFLWRGKFEVPHEALYFFISRRGNMSLTVLSSTSSIVPISWEVDPSLTSKATSSLLMSCSSFNSLSDDVFTCTFNIYSLQLCLYSFWARVAFKSLYGY